MVKKKIKKIIVKKRENTDIAKRPKASSKEKEFKTFMIWLTLPSVFLGKPDNVLEQLGINDEEAKALMKIKNMSQFAEKYKVRNTTLTDWKKKITNEEMIDNSKDFFKRLSKNIYASFYRATLKHGDAQRVRLWEEMFNEKKPEGSSELSPLLGNQFNQVIINLQGEFNSKLRDEYEKQIRSKFSGSRREHPDSAD